MLIAIIVVLLIIYLWMMSRKPYLRLFYKPGCPSCEKFMPEWQKLKQLTEQYEETDITKHSHNGFNFNTVPAIYLVTPYYKKKFDGKPDERTASNLLLFLKGD